MRVTTAEFIKHYGTLADRALSEPVTITKNGRDRLVVLSAGEYERLRRRDRRVLKAGELTDDEIALIARAEVPAEYAHLDEELKDWHPCTGRSRGHASSYGIRTVRPFAQSGSSSVADAIGNRCAVRCSPLRTGTERRMSTATGREPYARPTLLSCQRRKPQGYHEPSRPALRMQCLPYS
jgi:PHD/YefM family antitoxin component YafN of YafNO toxin-antitoxin module